MIDGLLLERGKKMFINIPLGCRRSSVKRNGLEQAEKTQNLKREMVVYDS